MISKQASFQVSSKTIAFVAAIPETFGFLRPLGLRLEHARWKTFWVANYKSRLSDSPDGNKTAWSVDRRAGSFRDLLAFAHLILLLYRIKPSVVYLNTPKVGLLGSLAAKLSGVPCVVYQLHGRLSDSMDRRIRIMGMVSELGSVHSVDVVWPVSLWMASWLRRELNMRPSKVDMIGFGSAGGVDFDRNFNPDRFSDEDRRCTREALGIPASARVVGFVGRFGREKGASDIISCWNELSKRYPDAFLLLVGGFESRYDSEESVRGKLENAERLRIVVWTSNVAKYYAVMDAFIFPTWREGLPYALIEACGMGVPIVTTPIPGCLEVLGGAQYSCSVCKIGDWVAMLRAIESHWRDPIRTNRSCNALRRSVISRYSEELVSEAQFERLHLLFKDLEGVVV